MHTTLSLVTFIRSLTVAACLGFLVPVLGLSLAIGGFFAGTYLPLIDGLSQMSLSGSLSVLAVFGTGCPVQGLLVIGAVFALVSILFDGYVTYRQHLF